MPQITEVPIGQLKPYDKNPRKISSDAVDAVAGSIAAFGFRQPIIVDKDHVIIAGHTRLAAAKKLGLETVPIVIAHDMTPEQVRAYRLADNRVAEFSQWDIDLLKIELDEIDLDLNYAQFDDILKEAPKEKESEPPTISDVCSQCGARIK